MMPTVAFAAVVKSNNIVVLATADVHGVLDNGFQFSGFRGFLDDRRKHNEYVSAVDLGDTIQGGAAGCLTKGMAIVKIMKATGYDVMVPGNHDFDYGVDYYMNTVVPAQNETHESSIFTSCNFKDKDGKLMMAPYIMKEYGDVKVAYVGITTPETLTKSRPTNFQDADGNYLYDFCNDATGNALKEQVQATVDEARSNGADYVIALAHLGDGGGEYNVWKTSDVVAGTTGIDALMDGHEHVAYNKTMLNKDGKDVPCVGMKDKLQSFGEVVIDLDKKTVTTNSITAGTFINPDEEYNKILAEVKAEVAELSTPVVAKTNHKLRIKDDNGKRLVRTYETNLGDFCADAYKVVTGADVAIVNGGAIRDDINKGDITIGDIVTVHPFGNTICVAEVSGQDIRDALELGARMCDGSENGGFLQVAGITYKINGEMESNVVVDDNGNFVSVDGDYKVYDIKINGEDIDLSANYTVAANDFMLKSGGDGFTMFMDNEVIREAGMADFELLIEYIQNNLDGVVGDEYAQPQGRIKVVSEREIDRLNKELAESQKREAELKVQLAEANSKTVIAKYTPKLKVKKVSKKYIAVKWNKCSEPGVVYRVYKKKAGSKKYSLAGSTTGTSYKLAKLKRHKKYYIRVVATKAFSTGTYVGNYSNTIKRKTK